MFIDEDQVDLRINFGQNDDVEFGDLDVLSSLGLPKITPSAKSAARVAIYPGVKQKTAWVHYMPGNGGGYYRCLSAHEKNGKLVGDKAACCQRLHLSSESSAKQMFAALAVQYLGTEPSGNYLKDATVTVELGWLKLSAIAFGAISRLKRAAELSTSFDFVMATKTKGMGYDYARAASPARWQGAPEIVAALAVSARPYKDGRWLSDRLGRVLDDLGYKALFEADRARDGGSVAAADKQDN